MGKYVYQPVAESYPYLSVYPSMCVLGRLLLLSLTDYFITVHVDIVRSIFITVETDFYPLFNMEAEQCFHTQKSSYFVPKSNPKI